MINLLPLAQDLCDGVTNYCASLFDLFLGQSEGDADLQPSWNDLLRLKVVFQGLETADKDTIGKTLYTTVSDLFLKWILPITYLINDILQKELLVGI